ncbi:MAG: polysaccharide pyruvyl transferase family protein [Lachnospiraceae bacterium]|nr:polysaccharide pyruvyl transferase family protein [Lachnospiraceae bacterium]
MKKRILNWGWYGFNNFGDDLLLRTMIDNINSPENDVLVTMNEEYFLEDVNEISRSYRQLFSLHRYCDAIIIGPGGLFPFDNPFKVFVYYLITILWKFHKKKVLYFGIGISEEMNVLSSILWQRIIAKSDLFITRNKPFLKRLKVEEDDKCFDMADVAFASNVFKGTANNCGSASQKTIGISVANLGGDEVQEEANLNVWILICKSLVNMGYNIDLLAFTKGKDDKLIDDISKRVSTGIRTIHYEDLHIAIDQWMEYDAVICMRFHSLVISILAGVPVLPIAYGHKTIHLAEECGLKDYLLYWNNMEKKYFGRNENVSPEKVIETMSRVIDDSERIKQSITSKREELVGSANEAFRILKEELDNI